MSGEDVRTLVLLLLPVLLIQLGVSIFALVDLAKRQEVRGPSWVWAVALVVTALAFPTGLIVSGLYLAWGRHTEG